VINATKLSAVTFIFALGFVLGFFYPYGGDPNVEMVNAKLEQFKRVEEICGKGNVTSNCLGGICNGNKDFTCYHWHRARSEGEK